MSDSIQRELGSISARLANIEGGQERLEDKLDTIDDRLGKVEIKSAKNGMVSGGIVAVAISFIKGQFPSA